MLHKLLGSQPAAGARPAHAAPSSSSVSCCAARSAAGGGIPGPVSRPHQLISVPLTSAPSSSSSPVACHAESDNNNSGYVSGPISVNTNQDAKPDPVTAASQEKQQATRPIDRSKGLWTRCDKCGVILYIKHLREHHHICYSCNFHMKMSSQERVNHLIDPGTWRPLDETLSPVDPLEFSDMKNYTDRIREAQAKTGLQDGVRTGTGLLHGIPVALGVMEFGFMGGSMGSVVGEKLTRLIEYATQEGLVLMIVCTSGGARMQEGILSLMQMAKISAALHVHQNVAKLLYISILTSPTTGGVTASFGMLGDICIAEPQALIGFAGRRVIEQTLQEQLPDDFQTAEYLLDHGLLDLVVPRSFLKGALFEMIGFYREAPFKQKGKVPYGIQHGLYMNTEEKVRRRMKQWESTGALTSGNSNEVSYKDLLESFKTLTEGQETLDLQQALASDNTLLEALDVAKNGRLEWVEQEEKEKDPNFVLRMAAN